MLCSPALGESDTYPAVSGGGGGTENRNAPNDTAALSFVENSEVARYVLVVVVIGDVMIAGGRYGTFVLAWWGRWSVWSLRLSGRWRLRWREGVRVVSCGHRDQRRGVRQRSGGGRVIGSASRCALEGLGHRQLPLRRFDRSRRRCLRCGRGRPRQCGRSGRGIVVGTGGVDFSQGRGFARSAIGVVVVVLATPLALLLGRALEGLPSQLTGRSRRCRLPRSRGRARRK